MRTTLVCLLAAAFWGEGARRVEGQDLSGGPPGLPPVLTRVFGDLRGFSAQANVTVEGRRPTEDMTMPMQFDYLRGRMRAEIDMSRVKGGGVSAEMLATLKQIGMDRVVTVMNGEGRPATILYPNLKASVEVKEPGKAPAGGKGGEIQETRLGEETVAGRVCDKVRMTFEGQEAVVWRARDLAAFPVRIRMEQAAVSMTVEYEDVKLEEPKEERFAVPSQYRRYESMQDVMKESMQRLLKEPAP